MKNTKPLNDERYNFILREYPDSSPCSLGQARAIQGLAYLCLVKAGYKEENKGLREIALQSLVDQAQELNMGY